MIIILAFFKLLLFLKTIVSETPNRQKCIVIIFLQESANKEISTEKSMTKPFNLNGENRSTAHNQEDSVQRL